MNKKDTFFLATIILSKSDLQESMKDIMIKNVPNAFDMQSKNTRFIRQFAYLSSLYEECHSDQQKI